jgi:RNA polymerase sigma-70 factor (ECF subfamily)
MLTSLDDRLARSDPFDERVLTEIYQTFSPRLYRYAYRLLGDVYEAEDVVAETFQRLLLALRNQAGPRRHLSAYLYRIAHNLITDRYRRAPGIWLTLDETFEASPDEDPLHLAAQRFDQDRARAALARLTADQRQVIVLKYLEGLSNEEIALTLDKPIGAVKALQHRAIEALRRSLKPEQVEAAAC